MGDYMGLFGIIWESMGFYGITWDSMGLYGIIWDYIGLHGILWDSMVLYLPVAYLSQSPRKNLWRRVPRLGCAHETVVVKIKGGKSLVLQH